MDNNEQMLLDRFFKEETTWFPEHWGFAAIGYIFLGIAMVAFVMPFQIWQEERSYLIFLYMEAVGMYMLLQRYYAIRQDGKQVALYEVIRYLPVSRRQLQIYCLRKLLKQCMWVSGISMICQVLFAAIFMHTFSWINIAAPMVGNFFVPMVLLGSMILLKK